MPLALLFAFGVSFVADAQVPNYPNGCARCGVTSFVDTPEEMKAFLPVVTGEWAIGGWGFERVSGRAVDRVDVFYSDERGSFKPAPWWLTRLDLGIERPDVANHYRPYHPNVVGDSGFSLRLFPGAVPVGTHVLRIIMWRGPYSEQSIRIVVVH